MDSQKCSPKSRCPVYEAYQCVLDAVHQVEDAAVAAILSNSLKEKWDEFQQQSNEASCVSSQPKSTSSRPVSFLHTLVLAEIELANLGIDVIYPCQMIMPLDLGLVRD